MVFPCLTRRVARRSFGIAALTFFVAVVCVSCNRDDGGVSFSASIENADKLVSKGQNAQALKELKKAEKYAYTPSSRLSLYKRYKRLGEKRLSEKILKKSVKKFPDNLELCAVWGQFLIRNNKIDAAAKNAKKLAGTQFGSIYSEAILKQSVKKNGGANDMSVFLSEEFFPIYNDIFVGTGDSRWLLNGALIRLFSGDYLKASLLEESLISKNAELPSKEAMFWAKVQFDAGNYDIALWNLDKVSSDSYFEEVAALRSDCYVKLNELELAEKSRSQLLSERELESSNVSDSDVLNIIRVNSALWAYSEGQYQRAWDLLMAVFEKNDAFVPALLSFGKIAWEDSQPVHISDLEKSLRKTTLRTDKMREFDERPRFLVSDAIQRLSEVEERFRKSEDAPDGLDALIVERISLFLRANSELPLKARTAEIWRTLELNESGVNLYPSLLVYFSVQKLISYGFPEEARSLFANYINAKYLNAMRDKTNRERSENVSEVDIFGGEYRVPRENVPEGVVRLAFGEKVSQNVSSMNVWEIELAAYFSLIDGNYEAAKRLYEFVLFESGNVVNEGRENGGSFDNVSTLASAASAVNLAMIYSSIGEGRDALSLYGLAAGKCADSYTKSKVLYRISDLQFSFGELESARISIDYSLALDPQNADARLLKRKMTD